MAQSPEFREPVTPGPEITSPPSKTAGEQDHSDPWAFAGEDADAPGDLGRPPAVEPGDTEGGATD